MLRYGFSWASHQPTITHLCNMMPAFLGQAVPCSGPSQFLSPWKAFYLGGTQTNIQLILNCGITWGSNERNLHFTSFCLHPGSCKNALRLHVTLLPDHSHDFPDPKTLHILLLMRREIEFCWCQCCYKHKNPKRTMFPVQIVIHMQEEYRWLILSWSIHKKLIMVI